MMNDQFILVFLSQGSSMIWILVEEWISQVKPFIACLSLRFWAWSFDHLDTNLRVQPSFCRLAFRIRRQRWHLRLSATHWRWCIPRMVQPQSCPVDPSNGRNFAHQPRTCWWQFAMHWCKRCQRDSTYRSVFLQDCWSHDAIRVKGFPLLNVRKHRWDWHLFQMTVCCISTGITLLSLVGSTFLKTTRSTSYALQLMKEQR